MQDSATAQPTSVEVQDIDWQVLEHDSHRRLVREFMSLTDGGRVPPRDRFLPERVPYALANLFFTDLMNLDGDVSVTPRIVGENMISLFGVNLTGVNLIKILPEKIAEHYIYVFRTMFKVPCLCICKVDLLTRSGLVRRVERLTMPLVRANGQLVIIASYQPLDAIGYSEPEEVSINAVLEPVFFTRVNGEPIFR